MFEGEQNAYGREHGMSMVCLIYMAICTKASRTLATSASLVFDEFGFNRALAGDQFGWWLLFVATSSCTTVLLLARTLTLICDRVLSITRWALAEACRTSTRTSSLAECRTPSSWLIRRVSFRLCCSLLPGRCRDRVPKLLP